MAKRKDFDIEIRECSCYTPFKPFLMDLVATNDLFMPNKLEFLSGVVLNNRKEHKAYPVVSEEIEDDVVITQ